VHVNVNVIALVNVMALVNGIALVPHHIFAATGGLGLAGRVVGVRVGVVVGVPRTPAVPGGSPRFLLPAARARPSCCPSG
jgi:hypothetical protein